MAHEISPRGGFGGASDGVFTPFLDFCWQISIVSNSLGGTGGGEAYLLNGGFLGLRAISFTLREDRVSKTFESAGTRLKPGYHES